MKSILYTAILTIIASMTACKTSPGVHVNKQGSALALYTNNDSSSAVPKPAKSETIDEVVKELNEEVTKTPTKVKPLINLAQLYLVREQLDKAEITVRKALKLDLKNKEAKIILSKIFFHKKLDDMSLIILNGLGGDKSKDARILNLMAMIELRKDNNSKAMALFKKALRLEPLNVAVRMNLGVLYLKYRQLNEAATQFERVTKIIPEHEDAQLHLAIIYASRNKTKRAEEIYEKVLDRTKNHPTALFNYAILKKNQNQHKEALALFKEYLKNAKGKSKTTEIAFLMIDEIHTVLADKGQKVSTKDIEKLAQEIDRRERNQDNPKKPAKVKVAKASDTSATKKAPVKKMAAKKLIKQEPASEQVAKVKAKQPKPKKKPKEISELEQFLLQ